MINLDGKVEDLKCDHGQSSETFSKHTRPVRARAITRERTEMTRLMMNEDYLHLLKSGLHNISDLFKNIKTYIMNIGVRCRRKRKGTRSCAL